MFSGGAFVEDNNVILSYWMLWGAKGVGLAKNIDNDFEKWEWKSILWTVFNNSQMVSSSLKTGIMIVRTFIKIPLSI